MSDVSFVNGQLVSSDEACLPVTDRGLLFGEGLYEVMRVYGGRPFQLNAHIERLGWGARKIGFDLGISLDSLRQACLDTLAANELKEAVLRLMVTRGDFIDQDKVTATAKPSVIVSCDEFKPYGAGLFERGVDVAVVTDGRSDLAMVNTLNRLPNIMAKREAEKKRCYEALLVTKKGFVMSGSQSNVFAVLDGILLTPPIGERVPPGITREAVLSIADKEGIPCKEDALINDEMDDTEEMFMTGTLIEVMPVASIDGRLIGSGDPGHQTKRIMQAFKLMTRGAY